MDPYSRGTKKCLLRNYGNYIPKKHFSFAKVSITSYMFPPVINRATVDNITSTETSKTNDIICMSLDIYAHDAIQLIILGVYISILAYNMYLLFKREY